MNTPPGPPSAAGTEFDLMGALFSPAGRADPQVILRGSPLPGCQYPFVRDVLRDPRFAPPTTPPPPDPAFQLLRRWMIRLDGDRHRRVRDAFGGLFTARRVERYRAIIARRAAGLIDQAAGAGSMDLVTGLAGHQTTTTLLTLGTHLLCTHPSAVAALQEDPGRWPAAVEEMLRLITPTTFTGATPRTDADIHGVTAPAGQPPPLFLAAANPDPPPFPDPDRFDINREPNPHLSFAAGAHFCLGAPLARLHGEVALSTLFTRLPSLAALTPPDITASVPIRQIDHFTVTWQQD